MSTKKVYDLTDDGGKYLESARAHLPSGYAALIDTKAALLKTASSREMDGFAFVFRDEYGGMQHRYPVMDQGNALTSALYFGQYGDNIPSEDYGYVREKLARALQTYGLHKLATATAARVLTVNNEQSDDSVLSRLFGADSDAFARGELASAIRNDMSLLEKRAAVMAAPSLASLDTSLSELVGERIGQAAAVGIETRAAIAGGKGYGSAEFMKLAAFVRANKDASPDAVIVELVELDEKYGLTNLYGSAIADPVRTVLSDPKCKIAEPCAYVNNKRVTEAALRGVAKEKLAEAFGAQFAEAFVSRPFDVFVSLPDPHKLVISEML